MRAGVTGNLIHADGWDIRHAVPRGPMTPASVIRPPAAAERCYRRTSDTGVTAVIIEGAAVPSPRDAPHSPLDESGL